MATNPLFEQPPAYMGYVGFVSIDGSVVRATSADIKLTQDITKPEVIDGRIDRTVYGLGPQEVGGSIAFPAIYDNAGGATTIANLWNKTCQRKNDGTLFDFPVLIKYAEGGVYNTSVFTYDNCVMNSIQFSVTNGDNLNITADIIGLTRTQGDKDEETIIDPPGSSIATDNSRVVTWADSRMELRPVQPSADLPDGGNRSGRQFGWVHPSDKASDGTDVRYIGGQHIRSYEVNVNNNVERFYTLNRALFAQAVAPSKRDVTGNVVFLGRIPDLSEMAFTNEDWAYEDSYILFGFQPSVGSSSFIRKLPNVVFQIEEMSITNNLFETTVNWHSLPAARITPTVTNPGNTTSETDPLLVDAEAELTSTITA